MPKTELPEKHLETLVYWLIEGGWPKDEVEEILRRCKAEQKMRNALELFAKKENWAQRSTSALYFMPEIRGELKQPWEIAEQALED